MGRRGVVAQLGERVVRNDEVRGSIPLDSTKPFPRRHVTETTGAEAARGRNAAALAAFTSRATARSATMRAPTLFALGLVPWAVLAPLPARAQEGPSFNCNYASTATEAAICGSPRLSRIERWVVESYEDLAGRIGQREARAIADVQLARRQDCEGDPACIEERLVATMQVFVANGATPRLPLAELPQDELAALGPTAPEPTIPDLVAAAPPAPGLRPLARPEPVAQPDALDLPGPEERLAMGPPLEIEEADRPEPLPDAAAAPFPGLEPDEAPVTEAALPRLPEASPEAVPGFGAGPEPRADPDSALADAFAALPAYRRGNLQGRLTEAGYGDVATSGSWDVATAAALAAFAREAAERGRAFDPSTPEGATALLDYVDSDDFRQTFLGEDLASGALGVPEASGPVW